MPLQLSETHYDASTQTTQCSVTDVSLQTVHPTTITSSTQTGVKTHSVSTQTSLFTPLPIPVPFVGIDQKEIKFSIGVIKDDSKVKFCIGLSWDLFQYVFKFVAPYVPRERSARSNFSPEDKFLLVTMRLHLDLILDDLAICFSVSKTIVSNVSQK